jgi:hypothetical protein
LRRYDLQPFLSRTGEGVSANLCEALVRLGHGGTPFEVRFQWARQLPAQVGAGRFRFDPGVIEVLRKAGKELRVSLPDGDIVIEGDVKRLSRERGDGGQVRVQGRIETVFGSTDQPVTVFLPGRLYQRALRAHGRHRQVRITGRVDGGRIGPIRRLEIVEAPSTDEAGNDPREDV